MLRDPQTQHVHRRPGSLFFSEVRLGDPGGIVDHVHQTAARTALLEPGMKAAVELQQFPKMLLARTAPPMRAFLSALAGPQSFFEHPAAQRLRVDGHVVFFGPMLGGPRRPRSRLLGAAALLLPDPAPD